MSHTARRALLLLSLLPSPAWAIVNLEGLHLESPPSGWSGALDFALSGNEGNTRLVNLDLGLRLTWRREPATRFLIINQGYSESRGQKARDRSFFHLRHIHRRDARRAWETFLQGERDAFARLRLRTLLGGGWRWRLDDKAEHATVTGLGAFYSRERLSDGDNSEDLDFGQWRANLYLIHKNEPDSHRRTWLTAYLQPDLADLRDLRILTTAGLAMDMGRGWTFTWQVNLNYDARPPLTVGRYDLNYRAGISRKF